MCGRAVMTVMTVCPIEEKCRKMIEDGRCQLECVTSICLFDFSDCNLKSSDILVSLDSRLLS